MTPAEHLKKAKALLEDPARWTQATWARDEDGDPVRVNDPNAKAWCAVGALRTFPGPSLAHQYLAKAMPKEPGWLDTPTDFNDLDETRHQDIMAWFDRAIALAEQV